MKLATFPNVSLKCIEYLILSIQSNPGQSQRYHLRRWHQYKYNRPDHHNGGHNSGFFTSPSYRDRIWTDVAPQDVNNPSYYSRKKSKSAQMHLTYPGWMRANTVRTKLGLQSIEWGTQDLPANGTCKIYRTMV